MTHPVTPQGFRLLTLSTDVTEDRGTSALPGLPTVADIRAGLAEIAAWADDRAVTGEGVCFVTGARDQLDGWCARAAQLLRRLPDHAIAVEVSRAAEAAFDEVASWAVQLAVRTGDDDVDPATDAAAVPHLADYLPAADG